MTTKNRTFPLRRGSPGLTDYSEEVPGATGNYEWSVRFDLTDSYVGITQRKEDREMERVLLSPAQVAALVEFVRSRRAR